MRTPFSEAEPPSRPRPPEGLSAPAFMASLRADLLSRIAACTDERGLDALALDRTFEARTNALDIQGYKAVCRALRAKRRWLERSTQRQEQGQ